MPIRIKMVLPVLAVAGAMFLGSGEARANEPVVVDVTMTKESFWGRRDFKVSVLHDDEGPEHYATQYEVLTLDGKQITNRILLHSHVNEQPFTRDTKGSIPDGVTEILVRAKDKVHGWGEPLKVRVPDKDKGIYVERQNDGSIKETILK